MEFEFLKNQDQLFCYHYALWWAHQPSFYLFMGRMTSVSIVGFFLLSFTVYARNKADELYVGRILTGL